MPGPFYPPSQLGVYTTIFRLIGADMNSTADQVFVPVFPFSQYSLRELNAVNGSAPITAVGGLYTGAGKTGTQIVAEDHSWALLSAPDKMDTPTLDSNANDTLSAAPYLSLTTPQGSPAVCDMFLMGVAG